MLTMDFLTMMTAVMKMMKKLFFTNQKEKKYTNVTPHTHAHP